MLKADLVVITTCINDLHINAMLDSVFKYNKHLKCHIGLLAQNNVQININSFVSDYVSLTVLNTNEIMPLSKARNLILSNIGFESGDYFMFADDDSTFDTSFFCNFKNLISSNSLIEVRTTENKQAYFLELPSNRTIADKKGDNHFAISVNQIVDSITIRAVGSFDENLGVGCYYGAGEDNDFFIRASKISPYKFCKELYTLHPDQSNLNKDILLSKLVKRYQSYGRGVVYMLCKHKLYYEAFKIVFRGYAGALHSLLKLNFKMSWVYLLAGNARFAIFVKSIFNLQK